VTQLLQSPSRYLRKVHLSFPYSDLLRYTRYLICSDVIHQSIAALWYLAGRISATFHRLDHEICGSFKGITDVAGIPAFQREISRGYWYDVRKDGPWSVALVSSEGRQRKNQPEDRDETESDSIPNVQYDTLDSVSIYGAKACRPRSLIHDTSCRIGASVSMSVHQWRPCDSAWTTSFVSKTRDGMLGQKIEDIAERTWHVQQYVQLLVSFNKNHKCASYITRKFDKHAVVDLSWQNMFKIIILDTWFAVGARPSRMSDSVFVPFSCLLCNMNTILENDG
jgi:hypothetical protein